MKRLIIIGCGPKALAISSKISVLKKLGWKTPEIVVIDKYGPAANWDGTNGYTNGELTLGTPPEEDMGFPYASLIDPLIDEEMQKFSWFSYLVSLGNYAEWINRHQPPTHKMWANYFKWVAEKAKVPITHGEVIKVDHKNDHWLVTCKQGSDNKVITGEGLVITGPGDPYQFPVTSDNNPKEKRIFDGQDIWKNIHLFKDLKDTKIAVIGGGETAAAAVTGLVHNMPDSCKIEIISGHPMLFTRNENWMEVMYFSTAEKWKELSKAEKIEIIRHADRGTFSPGTKNLIDSASNVSLRLGKSERIEIKANGVYLIISANGKEEKIKYDYIIQATGFNPFSFIKLINNSDFLVNQELISERIDYDLSVMGVSPKLHLPGLSAFAQGPGFPNLSCLGLLSERILSSYISK